MVLDECAEPVDSVLQAEPVSFGQDPYDGHRVVLGAFLTP